MFTRVRQICTVVDDFEATLGRLTDMLGIGPFRCWHFRAPVLYNTTLRGQPAVWTMKLGITWLDDVQWEVIQPMVGATLYREHLEARGRGVQHLLMDTAPASFEVAVARLAARGKSFDQTAMINARVQIKHLALPAIPNRLARPLSLQFGYLDLERELGSTIELTRYPLGFSERFSLRAGHAEFCIPDGNSHFERPLPNLRVRRACKATILTRDLDATVRNWIAIAGVGPWHMFQRADAQLAWALLDDFLIELVQPDAGVYEPLVRTRGEVTASISVEPRGSFDDLVDHCVGLGFEIASRSPLVGDHRSAFLAARAALGTDLEVIGENVAALFRRTRPDRVVTAPSWEVATERCASRCSPSSDSAGTA